MAQPRQSSSDAGGWRGGHLREVGAEDAPRHSDVAAELYQTRLRRGIELAHAAGDLRIHYEQLLAIEEGRFDDLPGPAYVIGFLRSYAAYLDLDGDEMVRRFKAETADFVARQDLTFPSPHDEGRVPTGALIALGLALVGAAYAGWYYVANVDRVAIERIPEVPERLAQDIPPESAPLSIDDIVASIAEPVVDAAVAPSGEPEARAAIEPLDSIVDAPAVAEASEDPEPVAVEPESEAVAAVTAEPALPDPAVVEAAVEEPEAVQIQAIEPQPVEPADAVPAAPVLAETPEPQQPEPQQTASVVPEIPAPVVESTDYAPREFGLANSGSTIRLRARLESWVQVTGADNELLLTRILRPGDVYHVPDREGLVLMTGNAGGLEILVGDVVAPALGPVGKVRRRVALDPERLLAGTAVE